VKQSHRSRPTNFSRREDRLDSSFDPSCSRSPVAPWGRSSAHVRACPLVPPSVRPLARPSDGPSVEPLVPPSVGRSILPSAWSSLWEAPDLIVPHKSLKTLPPGLPRTERQLTSYQTMPKKDRLSVAGLSRRKRRHCHASFTVAPLDTPASRVVTSDRGKPDGELDSIQSRLFFARGGSHPVVDPDRDQIS